MNSQDFLKYVAEKANTVVIDLEANMLDPYNPNARILGYSIYVPDLDEAQYFPFNHGVGTFEVKYSETNSPDKPFHKMTWQGDTKRAIWVNYWWSKWVKNVDPAFFGNLPAHKEKEVKDALNASSKRGALWIFHNAQFDMSWLEVNGVKPSANIRDTMVGMHIVHEDMSGVLWEAPYKWTRDDAISRLCSLEDVGKWARGEDGELLKKDQFGNYQLKWLCAMLGFEGATVGEETMHEASEAAKTALADFIAQHPDDPYNAGLGLKLNGETREDMSDTSVRNVLLHNAYFGLSGFMDKKANMWNLPAKGVETYAKLDTKMTWQLYEFVMERLQAWDNISLFELKCNVLRWVLYPAHFKGIHVDVDRIEIERENIGQKMAKLTEFMRSALGDPEFNPNSTHPSTRNRLIKGVRAYRIQENNARGVVWPDWWERETIAAFRDCPDFDVEASNADALEEWVFSPIIYALLDYRKMKKADGTYLKRWEENRDGNGVIHPHYDPLGTVSGRLSSWGPAGNTQNIPDRNGYTIKRVLIPKPDYVVVGVDYGQLELRRAAYLAEYVHGFDSRMPMVTMFESGTDMHAYTRDAINVRGIVYGNATTDEIVTRLGYKLNEFSPQDREKIVADNCRFMAKTMNFGLLYGGGGGMLSRLLGCEYDVASELARAWKKLYPAFGTAMKHYNEEGSKWKSLPFEDRQEQYVTETQFGRHRRFSLYRETVVRKDKTTKKPKIFYERQEETLKAWNNVVQGWGGELTQHAAYEMTKALGDAIHIFAIIHDAADMYVRRECLTDVIPEVVRIMTNYDMRPRLTADVTVGEYNWQDMYSWNGFLGVTKNKDEGGFNAHLDKPGGIRVPLGRFETKEEAAYAVQEARKTA